MRLNRPSLYAVCLSCIVSALLPAHAQDTLEDVLQRLKISQATQFDYTQTRQLALLQSPWQALGELYLSPGKMIIAQQAPEKRYILITQDTLQYLDVGQNIYHRKKLKGFFAVPQMAIFVSLIFGEHSAASLREHYATEFSSDDASWTIRLTDENDDQVEAVEISGQNGSPANSLELFLNDGDKTSWEFFPAGADENIIDQMNSITKKVREFQFIDRSSATDR